MAAHAWAAGQNRRCPGTGLESRNLEVEAGWAGGRVGGWLGLVLLWATGLHGLIIVLRSGLIRVLGVYTRITRNKFGFLEVLPEIEIGYLGFG